MLQTFQSSSAAERLSAASAFVERFPAATEVLIVGASRDAADDLARRVTAARRATFGLHRTSLTQLAVRFAAEEMARLGVAPATALGAEAVAARVSFEALREGALAYFAPVARFPGFARALAASLGELRLGRVAPGALEALEGPARDVAELARRFEGQLDGAKVADRAALLAIATRAAVGGALDLLRRMPMVLLDVSIASPAEQAFVDALTAMSPATLVTIPGGDDATLDAVRGLGARDRRDEQADGDGVGRPDADDSDLTRARDFLFAAATPPPGAARGDVLFFSAPGEGRETVEIARRILDEARAGTPFDEMAVLLRSPEVYASLLEVALRRAGIPAWFARGTSRPDPSGRAFLALVDCALEGLSARRFAEYLSLGQVPTLDEAGAPPVDRAVWTVPEDETLGPATEIAPAASVEATPPDTGGSRELDTDDRPVVEGTLRAPWRWEQLLVESAVIGGKDRWSRRLAGLEAEFRARLARFREEEPDSPRASAIERDLINLEHLRRFAVPVIERLTALPAQGTWGEGITALETLAPIVLRRPERVLTVLAALRPLDVIGPVALGEVRDVLAGELTTLAERPPADRSGHVFVGTIGQAGGRSFEVVFLPGLAERIFPQKPREDPILLDALRRDLGASHGRDRPPLATQDDRGHRERLLLRLAVGAARRRLHLSYSRIEQTEARPRVPSFYALEVARALTGRVPEPQRMEREAAAAAGARLAWPAPDDPGHAIGEVGHDLATLRAQLGSGEASGRARYLLELNDCLARSLRTRWARWRRRFTPADGVVRVTDGTRETLAAARLGARPYSASALQKVSARPCPFFLSAICRLEPRPEVAPIVELDPATRGHLFHRVQADAMRALADEKRLPLTAATLEPARAALRP